MENRKTGIYNVVNTGSITHKEILEMYHNIVDTNFKMPEFIKTEQLNTVAKRSNCTLSTMKLGWIGIKMRGSKEAIAACMGEYKNG
ncbi:MAG: hypothetical protein FP814_09650 [Desulfobacterium sp.]|nr:hypothetical protein [Desulfobacterium sp.]